MPPELAQCESVKLTARLLTALASGPAAAQLREILSLMHADTPVSGRDNAVSLSRVHIVAQQCSCSDEAMQVL